MSTGSHNRTSGIAVPALAKFAEHLDLLYFDELTAFIRNEWQNSKGIDHQESVASLVIQALLESDKNRLIDFLESGLVALDPVSIAQCFRQFRNLKNQLTLKISAYTNDAAEAITVAIELDALFIAAEDKVRSKLHADLIEPYQQLKHFKDRIPTDFQLPHLFYRVLFPCLLHEHYQ